MREYNRIRLPKESFGDFYDRILINYSPAAIGFIMWLMAYTRINGIELDFGLSTESKTGKIERFELFDFGCKIYKKLTGEEAYPMQVNFMPGDREKIVKPSKLNKNIDPLLEEMLLKMLDPNPLIRAKVFTEIYDFISIYSK